MTAPDTACFRARLVELLELLDAHRAHWEAHNRGEEVDWAAAKRAKLARMEVHHHLKLWLKARGLASLAAGFERYLSREQSVT